MTARAMLALLLRRWVLVLIGAVITVSAMYLNTHREGLYWTRYGIVVLPPAYERFPNKLEDPHFALAPVAGLVVRDWNRAHMPLVTASGDTMLYGIGRQRGIQVRMPNEGSQWRPLYTSPVIDVQVVGDGPDVVAADARRVYAELDHLLTVRQDSLGVDRSLRVTTIMSPSTPVVQYTAGSRARTAIATAIAGAATTFAGVYWLEQLLGWRRRRRPAPRQHDAVAPEAVLTRP